jgi:hypothetical protein
MEQDLRIDPETGFYFSDRRSADAKQNKGYTRHTDIAETTRDWSRPHTIPADEFKAATGRDVAEAAQEYEKNQEINAQAAAKAALAAH